MNNLLRVVGVGIGLLSVVFAVGLGMLVFYRVRPRGDKIGDTDLTNPHATLVVNAKPGASIVNCCNSRVPRRDILERQIKRAGRRDC